MAEKDLKFQSVAESLLQGMNNVLSTKTVVGEPIVAGDVIIVPLVDVSFGFGAGTGCNSEKHASKSAGGIGGKMSPNAVLIIKDGTARMVSVKTQDTVTKLVDMLPDLIDKVTGKFKTNMTDEEIVDLAFTEKEE